MSKYSPRCQFEITQEMMKRLDKHLGHYGIRKPVLTVVLEDLLNLIEQNGPDVVGILLSKAANPREVLPTLAEAERRTSGKP